MTHPDDPPRTPNDSAQPTDPTNHTRKDRTMFSPDTLRTLDAIGFPVDPIDRHEDREADADDPADDPGRDDDPADA